MNDAFEFIEKPYSQTTNLCFWSKMIDSRKYSIESLWLLDPNWWNLVPNKYKAITSVVVFKEKIKTWVPQKVFA